MNLKDYLEKHGAEAISLLASKCEVRPDYLMHCIYGYRRPSVALIEKLVSNDPYNALSPGDLVQYRRPDARRKYNKRAAGELTQ